MGYALKYQQSLETMTCHNCGMEFAAPEYWVEKRREDHKAFYCPNGHGAVFSGETATQKIARLEREKANAELSKRLAEQLLEAEKKKNQLELKRREKRAHAGVCQECHRTFSNVARHMQSKHKATKGSVGG